MSSVDEVQKTDTHLPTYEKVIAQDAYSLRLPTYRSAHLRRYHPYMRYSSPPPCEDKFMNTIFDDEIVELAIPSSLVLPTPTALALVVNERDTVTNNMEEVGQNNQVVDHAELQPRPLYTLIIDFVFAVQRAIRECEEAARPTLP